MAKTVYIIIFAIYIAFMLLIGLYFKKRAQSSKDYFHGSGIGPWVTALSFVAAYFSTVLIIGGGAWGYQQGMSTVWIGVGNVVGGCFLAWILLGPRLRTFSHRMNTMTIPEFLEKRFDSSFIRYYSSIIIVIFLIIYNASVAQGMGETFKGFIGFDYWLSVLICGAVIALYVTFGGYLSVVWTAMIQAIIMIAALSIMAIYALSDAGGLSNAVDTLSKIPTARYNLVDAPGPWGWGNLLGVTLTVSLGVWAMPQLLIRFYSIKSVKVLKVGTIVVTVGGAFAILAYFNGAMTRAVYPSNTNFLTEDEVKEIDKLVAEDKAKGLDADRAAIEKTFAEQHKVDDRAIPYFAKNNLPSVLGGIFLSGVLAAGMSTFAAILILIAGSILKDLVFRVRKKEFSDAKQVKIGRFLNLGITVISVFFAMFKFKMILDLTVFSWAVIAGAFFVPLVFGLYFKWITKTATILSMVSGSVLALLWRILRDSVKAGSFSDLPRWMLDFIGLAHEFVFGIAVAIIVIIVVSIFTKRLSKEHLDSIFTEQNTENT